MSRIVVIGGGWAGCAAALAAKNAGANEVILLERCDMLLGTGLVGGIMRNNGRYTAAEEAIAMGGGELFELADQVSRHKNINFPGHKHASLYDITKIEPAVKTFLLSRGISIVMESRVVDIKLDGQAVRGVITSEGLEIAGDVFVETTGTAGPPGNCTKYGHGCVMCVYRCPTFGPRISIAARIGIQEKTGLNKDGHRGAMSGACKLHKESLAEEIVRQLNKDGVVVIPVPKELRKGEEVLRSKACQQYAFKDFAENIILLDTGHAKLMSPYYPLELLRQVPGLENARFEDPYSGGIGNSVRFFSISPVDNFLKTQGVENLFCAGEKAGPYVGHTEAIITGTLAGYNALCLAMGRAPLEFPTSLVCGDLISFANKAMETEEGLKIKFTFSGGFYFNRMKEQGFYTTDVKVIKNKITRSGIAGVFKNTSG